MIARHGGKLAAGYLAAALVLGGSASSNGLGLVLLQLCGIALGILALRPLAPALKGREYRAFLLLAAGAVLWPIVQMIPLPGGVWEALGGRAGLAGELRALAGHVGMQPLSLAPQLTMASVLTLIVPFAAFLLVLCAEEEDRRRVLIAMLAVVAVSICIGTIQVAGADPAYFYRVTNKGSAVGFFANRNHQASLLVAALVVLLVAVRPAHGAKRDRRLLHGVAVATIAACLLLTGSRAGLALGLLALAGGWAVHARSLGAALRYGIAGGAAALVLGALVLLAAPGTSRMVARTSDIADDARVVAAGPTLAAARDFLPFGTGIGSFDPVYRWRTGEADLRDFYINHAHNDWIELAMTGGVPALLLALAFIVWLVRRGREAWAMPHGPARDTRLAAGGVLALLLLHSLVDYPLRTPGLEALFAAACALLLPVPWLARRPRRRPRREDAEQEAPSFGLGSIIRPGEGGNTDSTP